METAFVQFAPWFLDGRGWGISPRRHRPVLGGAVSGSSGPWLRDLVRSMAPASGPEMRRTRWPARAHTAGNRHSVQSSSVEHRWIAVPLVGCYTLQPTGGPVPQPGTVIGLDINDAGRVALGGSMGPEIGQVEGRLVQRDNSEFVVGGHCAPSASRWRPGVAWRRRFTSRPSTSHRFTSAAFHAGRSAALAAAGVGAIASHRAGSLLVVLDQAGSGISLATHANATTPAALTAGRRTNLEGVSHATDFPAFDALFCRWRRECVQTRRNITRRSIPTAGVRFINAVPDTGAAFGLDFRFIDIVENSDAVPHYVPKQPADLGLASPRRR